MTINGFNQALDAFDVLGRIPFVSTINAIFIRFPMGIIATIGMLVTSRMRNMEERSSAFEKIALYNFRALFGELLPGLNILFHEKVDGHKPYNTRLTY